MDCKGPNWYPFFILIVKNLFIAVETASPATLFRPSWANLGWPEPWTWLKRRNGFDRTKFSGYLHEEVIASDSNLRDRPSGPYQREVFCIKSGNQEPRREKSANVK